MRKKTNKEFLAELKGVLGEEYTPLEDYVNYDTSIKMKHNKCGNIYKVSPNNILNGRRCPKCADKSRRKNRRRYTQKDFEDIIRTEGEGQYKVLGEYTTVTKKVKIMHKVCGHVYDVSLHKFRDGRRCPECAKVLRSKAMSKTRSQFNNEVQEIFNGEYSVLGEYRTSTSKVKVRHNDCGHIWDVTAGSLLLGHGCPKCNSSKGEKAVREYLLSKGIPFEEEVTFSDCRNELPLPFDFALIAANGEVECLIEYHGEQHYRPITFFGGEEKFLQQQLHDSIKKNYCRDNDVRLIEIPYTEKNIKDFLERTI